MRISDWSSDVCSSDLLASAIAVGLAQGLPLERAVGRAHAYVQEAIATAPGYGRGHGPLNHVHTVRPFLPHGISRRPAHPRRVKAEALRHPLYSVDGFTAPVPARNRAPVLPPHSSAPVSRVHHHVGEHPTAYPPLF